MDGEEIVGAKQNRVLNISILLKEKSETIIPVSCTEAGRWSYTSSKFTDSGRMASSRVRSVKSYGVGESLRRSGNFCSDQSAIWDEIDLMLNQSNVQSHTRAMSDIYEYNTQKTEKISEEFPLLKNQVGIIVFLNGKPVGIDIISQKKTYKKFHHKLIDSYILDILLNNPEKDKSKISIDQVQYFFEEILESDISRQKSVGYGYDYRFASAKYVGSCLSYKNKIIHLNFFRIPVYLNLKNKERFYESHRHF